MRLLSNVHTNIISFWIYYSPILFHWVEPMMFFLLHVTWSCIIYAYVPFFSFLLVYLLIGAFLFLSGHHLLIPLLFLSSSVMIKSVRTFRRTSPNEAFIRNATLSYWTSPIPPYPLSFIVRVGNPFVGYPWVVSPTRVGRIAWHQACPGGFVASPFPSPEALEDKDVNDGSGDDDDDEDEDASFSDDEEMTTS